MNKNLPLASVLALCGTFGLASSSAHAGNGVDALDLLPDDAMLVMSVDVAQLGNNKLAKDLFGLATRSSDFAGTQKQLLSEANLDVSRDVDTLTISVSGDIDDADKIVLVARGRFNKNKVTAFLKKDAKAFATKQHRGLSYHVLDDTEFAFLGKYFVATPKGGMSKIIDVHKGKARSLAKSGRFKSLLGKGHTKDSMWMGLMLTAEMRKEITSETGGHGIDAMVVGVDIGTDMSLNLLLRASDKEAATGLQTMLEMAAREAAKEPSLQMFGLGDALKKMVVKVSGNDVSVALTVPGASLQQLIPLLQAAL